jgi:hypothetical protein
MDRPKRYLSDEREAPFPNLRKDAYEVTSDEDWVYNCIAHAAGKKDFPWWPMEQETEGVFWPEGVPRKETVDAFVEAFGTAGFRPCEPAEDGPGFLAGFEKVVLYVDAAGVPCHAAVQTAQGKWSSKLGDWEDIEHNVPEDVGAKEGDKPGYGTVKQFLIRGVRPSAATPAGPTEAVGNTQSAGPGGEAPPPDEPPSADATSNATS